MLYRLWFILSYNGKNCESEMVGSTVQGEAHHIVFGIWAWMRLDLPQVIVLVNISQTYKNVVHTLQRTIMFLYKGQSVDV